MQDTKKIILQNAGLLNIRLNQQDKKAILVKRFADTILREPMVVLRRLPYAEIIRLREMVHDKDHAVPFRFNLVSDCISLIGLTDHITIKDVGYEFIYHACNPAFTVACPLTLDPKITTSETILFSDSFKCCFIIVASCFGPIIKRNYVTCLISNFECFILIKSDNRALTNFKIIHCFL